jgi:hypothetical protein
MLELTVGLSGAEIEGLVNSASVIALRDFVKGHYKNKEQNITSKIERRDLEKFRITLNHFIQANDKLKIILKKTSSDLDKNIGSQVR